jgi:NitT/TauT family transport system ATP-binding protein
MTAAPPKLALRDIAKSFPTRAGPLNVLDGLSFDVAAGDFVSIVGPSGCGKTTIFNIIAGLLAPDRGILAFDGVPIAGLRGRVGYMMQKDLLLPWRTVLGNVVLGLELRGVAAAEAADRARRYLGLYGLAGFENAYPRALSGGMRQRAALIRTLIVDPDILLLDEPFSALDYQTRLYLEGVLIDAVAEFKKTVILVTHDIDEAVALSRRVIVLNRRPATVRAIHDIDIGRQSPVAARGHPEFRSYFKILCNELEIQTGRGGE